MFLDTNILAYARLGIDARGDQCREILRRLEDRKGEAVANVLVLDELVWVLRSALSYPEGIAYARDLLRSAIRFEGIGIEDAPLAFEFMERGLRPRDAFHAAFCINRGIYTMVTDDADFKKVGEIEAISPAEALTRMHP